MGLPNRRACLPPPSKATMIHSVDPASQVGLGLLYVAIGTAGTRLFDRLASVPAWLLYFGLETLLAMVILLFGSFYGSFWIITLPLVSQSVSALPRRWSPLVCRLLLEKKNNICTT